MANFVCLLLKHKWELVRISGEQAYECQRCGKRDFDRPRRHGVGAVGPGVGAAGGTFDGGDFGGGSGD
jgi:hypothetical protein